MKPAIETARQSVSEAKVKSQGQNKEDLDGLRNDVLFYRQEFNINRSKNDQLESKIAHQQKKQTRMLESKNLKSNS